MKSLLQVVVPIAILMALVGLIAYMTQNTTRNPKISKPVQTTQQKSNSIIGEPVVWLDEVVIDPPPWVVEWRSTTHRHYLFANPHPYAVEMALELKSCTCSEAGVGQFVGAEDVWDEIQKSPSLGAYCRLVASVQFTQLREKTHVPRVRIPATPAGKKPLPAVLRVTWEAKKAPAEAQNEKIRVMVVTQVEGGPAAMPEKIVHYRVAPSYMFHPFSLDFGEVLPGGNRSASLFIWSEVRPELKVTGKVIRTEGQGDEPCATVADAVELSHDEIQQMLAGLPDPLNKTSPLCGYRLTVTYFERKGDHQAEMGPIDRRVHMTCLDGAGTRINEDKIPLTGQIRGEVRLLNGDPKDRLAVGSFRSDRGKKAVALIGSSDPRIELEGPIQITNDRITAKLDPPVTMDGQRQWSLHIEIAGNAFIGDIPAGTQITLRTKGTNPRLLRIPIVGKADR